MAGITVIRSATLWAASIASAPASAIILITSSTAAATPAPFIITSIPMAMAVFASARILMLGGRGRGRTVVFISPILLNLIVSLITRQASSLIFSWPFEFCISNFPLITSHGMMIPSWPWMMIVVVIILAFIVSLVVISRAFLIILIVSRSWSFEGPAMFLIVISGMLWIFAAALVRLMVMRMMKGLLKIRPI